MVDAQEVIGMLRACLLSIKGGIAASNLDRDYKLMVGSRIPYQKLGHTSLEQFLRTIPNLKLCNEGGQLMVHVKPTESSEHIAYMVAQQKDAKKRPIRRSSHTNYGRGGTRRSSSYGRASYSSGKQDYVSKPVASRLTPAKPSRPTWEPLTVTVNNQHERTAKRSPSTKTETYKQPWKSKNSGQPLKNASGLSPLQEKLANLPRKGSKKMSLEVCTVTLTEMLNLGMETEPVLKLEEYIRSRNINEPVYKLVVQGPRDQTVVYTCQIKIGGQSYSTPHNDGDLPEQIVDMVTQRAMEELQRASESIGTSNQDENSIIKRVAEFVEGHPSGIWSNHIPLEYKEKYDETLPEHWLDIISKSPYFTMDVLGPSRIILTPNDGARKTPPPEPDEPPSELAILVLPTVDNWDVYVTYAISTVEVWVRLIGDSYSAKYEDMANDMDMFYMGSSNEVEDLEERALYAIKLDGCWSRVELQAKVDDELGQLFFVDHGECDNYPLSELKVLDPRFLSLAPQAVLCTLMGLEGFANDPNAGQILMDRVLGRSMVATVVERDDEAISIVLYDTSTDEDLNVNTMVAEDISRETMGPQVPQEGKAGEMYLSCVTNDGDVYMQVQTDSFTYMMTLLTELVETGLREDCVLKLSDCNPNPDQLYLARIGEDWARAVITRRDPGPSNRVEVQFVDSGHTEMVNPSDLLVLEQLSRVLALIPHQAIKVSLHNVPPEMFTPQMAARMRELVPGDEPALVKVVKQASEDNIPIIEMFKRIEPENLLVSINNTLELDPLLVKQNPKPAPAKSEVVTPRPRKVMDRLSSWEKRGSLPNNNSGKLKTADNVVTDKCLKPPTIPNIGSFFDVNVTMVANPGNFTVQPLVHCSKLDLMMLEIQELYDTRPFPPITRETVKEGCLYAGVLTKKWYRVCVSQVIDNMVSAYLCDFGQVSLLHVDNLQPLIDRFKELPYQAIKAKLAGVAPSHTDWSVHDCLMFQELVMNRQFVSVVVFTGPDVLNPSDTVIGLTLIDTSEDNDVYLDRVLVERGIAVPFTTPNMVVPP